MGRRLRRRVWGRFEVSEGGEGSKDGEFVYGSEDGEVC